MQISKDIAYSRGQILQYFLALENYQSYVTQYTIAWNEIFVTQEDAGKNDLSVQKAQEFLSEFQGVDISRANIEVFDGYSANWGASLGDVVANVSGTALYVSQELLWKEQRITPKFSFHTTHYASLRPDVLGSSFNEQILKDYNGQTYWLSCNIQSFFAASKIPKWFSIAIGYGAEGMIEGSDTSSNAIFLPETERFRQFYPSFDVDLTRIPTKNHTLKTIFSLFNTIKIPAPTLEVLGNGRFKWHAVYF